MGFAETMRILSNINCGLASGVSYLEQKQNGVSTTCALGNLFGNLANGVTRNEIAYNMQCWGNPTGNFINMYSGYGNPVSNTIGTLGLLGACSPWVYFNQPTCFLSPYTPYGCGGGFFGGLGMGFGSFSITTTTYQRGFFG
jgi:hypothetical protein